MQSIEAKSILNKKSKRDDWFLDDYTLNPYSGCTFNCQFCYIRGSKYGEHMEKKTSAKVNAIELLDKQLFNRAKKKEYGIIVLGSATDAYLHFEEELQLTRQLLEVIRKYQFPVHIITRSPFVQRDFDLLKDINQNAKLPADLEGKINSKVFLSFSFSSINDELSHLFEPGAPLPSERLIAMKTATENGITAGASLMPLLPYLSDTDVAINQAFEIISNHKAKYIMAAGLTLFGTGNADSKTLTLRIIDKHFPELKWKYRNLYSLGHSPHGNYHSELMQRINLVANKFDIPQRLWSL